MTKQSQANDGIGDDPLAHYAQSSLVKASPWDALIRAWSCGEEKVGT